MACQDRPFGLDHHVNLVVACDNSPMDAGFLDPAMKDESGNP
jgi:hypothetical protein